MISDNVGLVHIINAIKTPVCIIDMGLSYVYANDSLLNLAQAAPESLINRGWLKLFSPEFHGRIEHCIRNHNSHQLEVLFVTQDSRRLPVTLDVERVDNLVMLTITTKQKIVPMLQTAPQPSTNGNHHQHETGKQNGNGHHAYPTETSSIYREAIEGSIDAFLLLEPVHDEDGDIVDFVFVDVNAGALLQTTYTRKQLIGAYVSDIFPEDLQTQAIERFAHLLNEGGSVEDEYFVHHTGFVTGWYHYQIIAVHDSIALFVRDITDQKIEAIDLEESQSLLQSVMDNIPGGLYRGAPITGIIFASEGFSRLFGYDSALDMRNIALADLFDKPDHLRQIVQAVKDADGYENVQVLLKRRDGSRFWALTNGTITHDEDGGILFYDGAVIDITELKLAEEALQKSRDNYQMLMQQASDAVFVLQPDMYILNANQHACELLNMQEIDVVGLPLIHFIHPDDHHTVKAAMQRVMAGQTAVVPYRLHNGGGQYLYVEGSTRRLSNGQYQSVVRDITERLKMQEAILEQERLHVALQKEKELGAAKNRMMSIISHEFRTPLTVIQTAMDMLKNYYDRMSAERRAERYSQIRLQIEYLDDMLEDMSLLARGEIDKRELKLSVFDLRELSRMLLEEYQETVGKNHYLRFKAAAAPCMVEADRLMMTRIVGNLLSNAVKYSPQNTNISLRLLWNERSVLIEVEDEGIGIPEGDQDHIFEAFYRVDDKTKIKGIGLGLALVHECVELHGGSITIHSQVNVGTVFTVGMPIVTDRPPTDDN